MKKMVNLLVLYMDVDQEDEVQLEVQEDMNEVREITLIDVTNEVIDLTDDVINLTMEEEGVKAGSVPVSVLQIVWR